MKLNFVKYNDNILALIIVAHKLFLDYCITVFCGAADQGVEEAKTDSGALMSNLCLINFVWATLLFVYFFPL